MCRDAGARSGAPDRAWDAGLIPFQPRPGGGWSVLEPGPSGRDGGRTGSSYDVVPSYYALVRATADALERGGRVLGREPRVVRGSLRWTPSG
jgi:hypothetical protein